MNKMLILNDADNTGVVIDDVTQGENVIFTKGNLLINLTAVEDIPFGFKIALQDINKGADIIKYGQIIGASKRRICIGELVHVHNVEGKRGRGDLLGDIYYEKGNE